MMKIAVWDTYVERANGMRMHFDILVPEELTDENLVYAFGRQYLDGKSFETRSLDSSKCNFCHWENATPEIESAILQNGFYILEMENCS